MRDGDRYTFDGDPAATKFSRAARVTRDDVDRLEKAWEFRSGDVSDGGGATPKTVWTAKPLYVNDTLCLGTPLYRILEPDAALVLRQPRAARGAHPAVAEEPRRGLLGVRDAATRRRRGQARVHRHVGGRDRGGLDFPPGPRRRAGTNLSAMTSP